MVDGKPKVWMRKQTEEVQREPVMHRVAESIRQATENQKHKSVKDRLSRPKRRLEWHDDEEDYRGREYPSIVSSSTGGSRPQMIRPPVQQDRDWHRVRHPKFPSHQETLTRTQKRRLQRQRKEVHENWKGRQEYRVKQRNYSQDQSSSQELKSASEEVARYESQDSQTQRWNRADVDMVYLLPAQFHSQASCPGHTEQITATESDSVEVTLGARENSIVASPVSGIQIGEKEGPRKVVTHYRPLESMLSHVWPLYVQATLGGVPMTKVLVDNGAAGYYHEKTGSE